MEEKAIIVENENSTVVSKYQEDPNQVQFASEKDLEDALINKLTVGNLGYELVHFKNEQELEANLRTQLEAINEDQLKAQPNKKFPERVWEELKHLLFSVNNDFKSKTDLLQNKARVSIEDNDTGEMFNINLIDKECLIKNKLQVMHQYTNNENINNRYDVTILLNGFPIVGIELKRSGVDLRQAFNQIQRYQRDSFSASPLFEFIQLFVISNGTLTKYYSNTVRDTVSKKNNELNRNPDELKGSSSYQFAITWTDQANNHIDNLMDFATYFLAKNKLLKIITKYCVFNTKNELLVMRPYQIAATEKIIERINCSHNNKTYGTLNAGGYIWHTTGSGKTLTSFKTATLLQKELPFIDKVLFVVDRKDLDYQTVKEYEKFKKDCVSSTKDTRILAEQLESNDPNKKIIVTTIQKLSKFINNREYVKSNITNQEIVFIFDECHRSQFGKMHLDIIKNFKKYHLFGFTGTPIFKQNANKTVSKKYAKAGFTTADLFGDNLHQYTIVDAIKDNTVLKFMVKDYSTIKKAKDEINSTDAYNKLNKKSAWDAKERIVKIAKTIDDNYFTETLRYNNRKAGFNAMLACDSIDAAKKYYLALKDLQKDKKPEDQLKIGIIYSYAINPTTESDNIDEIDESAESLAQLSKEDKDFLADAVKDYNQMFKSNFDVNNSNNFDSYYKDVSDKLKNKQLDLLIVVNMFLTGFDAQSLNTLFVDKNLRDHNLIQAFSRTNRILDQSKAFGNIVCFRNLEEEVNDAIQLFGDKNAGNIILMRTFSDYKHGYTDEKGKEHIGYDDVYQVLTTKFANPKSIVTDQDKTDFILMFNNYLKLKNILASFSKTEDEDHSFDLLPNESVYLSIYNELYRQWRSQNKTKQANIANDIVFEVDLIKQTDINVDFILNLIKNNLHKYDDKDKFVDFIMSQVAGSLSLYSKKELIEKFLNSEKVKLLLNDTTPASTDKDKVNQDLNQSFFEEARTNCKKDLLQLVSKEQLDLDKLLTYLQRSQSNNNQLITDSSSLNNIKKQKMHIFPKKTANNEPIKSYQEQKQELLDALGAFFDKYKDLITFSTLDLNTINE